MEIGGTVEVSTVPLLIAYKLPTNMTLIIQRKDS